jgi:hypothetical protein
MKGLALTPRIKNWLYQLCLLNIVLLSASSYYLSTLAHNEITLTLLENFNSDTDNIGVYTIVQYSAMAIFMLGAWYFLPVYSPVPSIKPSHKPSSKPLLKSPLQTSVKSTFKYGKLRHYKSLFLVAIIARVLLLGVEPYSSNDVDRYLFDGRIAYEGFDPYRVSHDDESLTVLRAQWTPPAEHAKYVTLYPPLALSLFALSASTGVEYAQFTWKIILLLASIATVYITALVLKKLNRLKHLPLVAFSPLLILETGVGLHLDALSTLAVISAIYTWQHKKIASCGALIGIGMLLKVLPLMLLLPLFFIQTSFKQALTLVISCLAVMITTYSITFAIGLYPIGSMGVFFEKWRFASPLFTLLDSFLSGTSIVATLLIITMILASAVAYASFFSERVLTSKTMPSKTKEKLITPNIFICIQLAIAIPLIVSPVVFPWYLMALVPLFALRPNIYLLAWLLIMPLTYEVIGQFLCCQVWQPAIWPIILLGALYLITLFKILTYFYQNRTLLKCYLTTRSKDITTLIANK